MTEPIAPAVPASRLPRLHTPSVAVIAAATASVLIAYKGANTWRASWVRPPEVPVVTLTGTGIVPNVRPDVIEITAEIDLTGTRRTDVERSLRAKSMAAVEQLRSVLGPDAEIRTDGMNVSPEPNPSLAGLSALSGPDEPFRGTQTLSIRSTSIANGIAAYHALEALGDPSLSLSAPRCSLLDSAAARRAAVDAAWKDLHAQVEDARSRAPTRFGRTLGVNGVTPSVEVAGEWSCEDGFVAKTSITVSYAIH